MTTVNNQIRRLLEGLYLKTVSGDISWSYDSAEDKCEAQIGSGYIQVLGDTDEDGDYFNYVRILNSNKVVSDNIYGGTPGRSAIPSNTGHSNYWELIRDLKSAAQRSALGSQEVLLSMISALDADKLDVHDLPF